LNVKIDAVAGVETVVGVDGCKGGWVAARLECRSMTATLAVHRDFADVLSRYEDAAAIGVDIPIGLGGCMARACDVLARRELGRRASSIFAAPDRRLLEATDYKEALAESRRLCGKGISKQAFHLFAKIREIDQMMTPDLQRRVIEVHPELCFTMLAGKPAVHCKSTRKGFEERKKLLPIKWHEEKLAAKPDDVLDSLAVAWVAHEFAHGRARRIPAAPEMDERGLRMEIVTCVRPI
jgi:predicted RNase H-like nuclease